MIASDDEGQVYEDCPVCSGNGYVYFYFKDSTAKKVRTTSLYCPKCFPDSTGVKRGPRMHEVEITFEEMFKLIYDEGWYDDGDE